MNLVEAWNFVKWVFRGSLTDPTTYGVVIAIAGMLAKPLGVADPYPWYTFLTGIAILCVTAAYYIVRIVHAFYVMDQSKLFDVLRKKD